MALRLCRAPDAEVARRLCRRGSGGGLYGGTRGISSNTLADGILIRIPAKEYAFLEIDPELDSAGFNIVDQRLVKHEFAIEKPKIEERAQFFTDIEARN